MRDLDASKVGKAIKERSIAREEAVETGLRKASPWVVIVKEAIPFFIKDSHLEKLLLSGQKLGDYGDLEGP